MNATERLTAILCARPGTAYLDDHHAKVAADVIAQRDTEAIPAWEAVYEPGNVSDYLIGYTNDETTARAAAEAWYRSQRLDEPGRLEWVPEPVSAVGRHDSWFDLVEIDADDTTTGTGITVRHRKDAV